MPSEKSLRFCKLPDSAIVTGRANPKIIGCQITKIIKRIGFLGRTLVYKEMVVALDPMVNGSSNIEVSNKALSVNPFSFNIEAFIGFE